MRYVADYTTDLAGLADRVGVRARSLAQMSRLGVPVPPGFAISDVVCRRFLETGDLPVEAWDEIVTSLQRSADVFRDNGVERPVLFSVRSSPSAEMPGVLNSALYLGLTDTVRADLTAWGGAGFAAAVRLGFLKTLGRLRGLSAARYRGVIGDLVGPQGSSEWSLEQTNAVCDAYEALIVDESQRPIPPDQHSQIREGIEAVFASWDGLEGLRFRRSHHIPDEDGMGLVVHPMIFGEAPGTLEPGLRSIGVLTTARPV